MMSRLDGFRMATAEADLVIQDRPFMTILKNNVVVFSKGAVTSLRHASHIHIFFDDRNRRFAIQPCEEDADSYRFFEPNSDNLNRARCSVGRVGSRIREYVGEEGSFQVYGEYYEDEDVIIFNCRETRPVRRIISSSP